MEIFENVKRFEDVCESMMQTSVHGAAAIATGQPFRAVLTAYALADPFTAGVYVKFGLGMYEYSALIDSCERMHALREILESGRGDASLRFVTPFENEKNPDGKRHNRESLLLRNEKKSGQMRITDRLLSNSKRKAFRIAPLFISRPLEKEFRFSIFLRYISYS